MLLQPGKTIAIVCTISVVVLSYVLRIFEMPYNLSVGSLLFNDYITSVWCVVITMTTVGYGDVYAVTWMGRTVSIINALWGGFVIGTIVASITSIFSLGDDQKNALAKLLRTEGAAKSVTNAIRFVAAKKTYWKHNQHKLKSEEDNQIEEEKSNKPASRKDIPKVSDIIDCHDRMINSLQEFREQKRENNNNGIESSSKTDDNIELLKEQMLDVHDKFDFLINYLVKKDQGQIDSDELHRLSGDKLYKQVKEQGGRNKLRKKELAKPLLLKVVDMVTKQQEDDAMLAGKSGADKSIN